MNTFHALSLLFGEQCTSNLTGLQTRHAGTPTSDQLTRLFRPAID